MSIKFTPSLEEIQEYVLVQDGNTIPVYATIPADLLTPVSAYLRIAAKSDYSFLLESISGAVGHFDFSNSIDTCIAIRTMVFKNGVAYLQAVYDSVEEDEYKETVNKLKSNVTCIDQAEQYHYRLHQS
ncbi:6902_t:CDS:2 [Entrophospora sp. SA101]|nr:6902_t:CDS:2 [Entrophospora sp. SA101]